MPKPTSYICERSAEYALIPELVRKLKERFSSVTPIYPWMTREGSGFSKELHTGCQFKVLGLYARRPKLMSFSDSSIQVKFNEGIILGAAAGRELGIPMIAGCPLARNFLELGSCNSFLWADLRKFSSDEVDLNIVVDASLDYRRLYERYLIADLDDVLSIVEFEARYIDVRDLIDFVKIITMSGKEYGEYHPFAYMGGYKAVYILLANP